jgi:hypothetical protein
MGSMDPLTPPEAEFDLATSSEHRRRRAPAALFHISERHAATPASRARGTGTAILSPHDATRLVEMLAAGSAQYEEGEPTVDRDDLLAALTLVPLVRAELDETELGLMVMARGRGLTWAQIAVGLGLGSAQAAHQRHDRLASRADSTQ